METSNKVYYVDDVMYNKNLPLLQRLLPYLMLLRKEVDFEKTMLTREMYLIEDKDARDILLNSIENSISTTLCRNTYDQY
jgi:hypothetical protein